MINHELLAEAKKRYPIGTVFKSSLNNTARSTVKNGELYLWRNTDICIDNQGGYSVYTNGKWAEIISMPAPQEIINNYSIY